MSLKVNKHLDAPLEKFFEGSLHKAAAHLLRQAAGTQKSFGRKSPFYAPNRATWRGKAIMQDSQPSKESEQQESPSPMKQARQGRAKRYFNKAMPSESPLWGSRLVKKANQSNKIMQRTFECVRLGYNVATQLTNLAEATPIATAFGALTLLQRNASDVLNTPQKVLNLGKQIRIAYDTKQHYNQWQAFIKNLSLNDPQDRFDATGNNTPAAWQEAFGKYCKDQHHYLEESFKVLIQGADLGLHLSAGGLNGLATVSFIGGLIGLATGGEISAVLMPLSASLTVGASVASTSKAGLVIGYEGLYKPLRSGLKWYQKNQWAKADLASPESKRYQKAQDQVYAMLKTRVQTGEISATELQQQDAEIFRQNLHAQTVALLNEQRSHNSCYKKALHQAQTDWQAAHTAGAPLQPGIDEQTFVAQRTDALIQAERMRRDSGFMSQIVAQNLVREQSAYLKGEYLYLDTTAPWTHLVMSGLGLVDHEIEAVINQDTPKTQAALLQALVKKSKKIFKESGQEAPVPMPEPFESSSSRYTAGAATRASSQIPFTKAPNQPTQQNTGPQSRSDTTAQWTAGAQPAGPRKADAQPGWQRSPRAQAMQQRKAEAAKLASQYLGKAGSTSSKSKAGRIASSFKELWGEGLGQYQRANRWSGLLYGPLAWNRRCVSLLASAANAQNLDRAAGLASGAALNVLDAFQIPAKVMEAYESVIEAKHSFSTYKAWNAAKDHYQQQQGANWFDAQKGEGKPQAYFASIALNCRSRNDPVDKTLKASLSVGEALTHTAGVVSGGAATLALLGVVTAPVAVPLSAVSLNLGLCTTGISTGRSLYKISRQGYRWHQKKQLKAADMPRPDSKTYQRAEKRAAKVLQAQGTTPQDPEYSSTLKDRTELLLTRKRVRSTAYQAAQKEALKELEGLRAAGIPVASESGFITRYIDTKVQTQRMRVDTSYAARVLVEHLHQEQGRYKTEEKVVPELTDQTPFSRFLVNDLRQNQAGLETVLNLEMPAATALVTSWLKKASPPAVVSSAA